MLPLRRHQTIVRKCFRFFYRRFPFLATPIVASTVVKKKLMLRVRGAPADLKGGPSKKPTVKSSLPVAKRYGRPGLNEMEFTFFVCPDTCAQEKQGAKRDPS